MRLLLINPNTSAATTAQMLALAQASAPEGVTVDAATAPFGVPLITDEPQLARAAEAVVAVVRDLRAPYQGVIVSAFGDPGLDDVRGLAACPATGLCEAATEFAATDGRRFAIATTTPLLKDAILGAVARYGRAAQCTGVRLTQGELSDLMADPARLEAALEDTCRACLADGAEAIVIGGGPLAWVAPRVAPRLPVPIIEPVSAAVALAVRRAR